MGKYRSPASLKRSILRRRKYQKQHFKNKAKKEGQIGFLEKEVNNLCKRFITDTKIEANPITEISESLAGLLISKNKTDQICLKFKNITLF